MTAACSPGSPANSIATLEITGKLVGDLSMGATINNVLIMPQYMSFASSLCVRCSLIQKRAKPSPKSFTPSSTTPLTPLPLTPGSLPDDGA